MKFDRCRREKNTVFSSPSTEQHELAFKMLAICFPTAMMRLLNLELIIPRVSNFPDQWITIETSGLCFHYAMVKLFNLEMIKPSLFHCYLWFVFKKLNYFAVMWEMLHWRRANAPEKSASLCFPYGDDQNFQRLELVKPRASRRYTSLYTFLKNYSTSNSIFTYCFVQLLCKVES